MSQSSPTIHHQGEHPRDDSEKNTRNETVTRSGDTSAASQPGRDTDPRAQLPRSDPRSEARAPESSEAQKRSFGMRNILNPSQQDIANPSSTSSPETLVRPNPRLPSPIQSSLLRQPSVTHGGPNPNISSSSSRPILTPRSPSLRASSLGTVRGFLATSEGPSGSHPARRVVDTHFAAKPERQPSPSTMSVRPPYNFPPMTEGKASAPPRHPQESHSVVASPVSGQMGIPQHRQTQEPYQFGGISQRTPFTPSLPSPFGQREALAQAQQHSAGPSELQPDYGAKTRQMFLDTAQGPIGIEVEVDTQAASRMADEKRRRNAGASARFRQRRKEKEREASHTISSLENDMKQIAEERDFYLNERNFYRDFASRFAQLPPRPVSPQQRRRLSSGEESWQSQPRHVEPPGRNQRRRTSLESATMSSSAPPAPSTGPPQTLPLPPLQGAPPLPYQVPPFSPNRPHLAAPPITPAMSMPPRTLPPYESLRPQEPYDRSWNPGR